jgi:hypothetical protein
VALPNERIAAGLAARETARASVAARRLPQPMVLVPPGGRPVPRRTSADLAEQAGKIMDTEREVSHLGPRP